jgi:SAM-dependent methyltransferase
VRTADFEYLFNLEEHYWWFVAMRRITDAIVAPDLERKDLKILDAGCGTGYNLQHYARSGQHVFALDIAPEAIDAVRARGFRNVCQASVTAIPYKSETFDLAFSFDVLEQFSLKLGEETIREMHRVLKPGGAVFVRAPAFDWMRSSHDDDLRSERRYTRTELVKLLRDAGFQVQLATYANTFLFPVALVTRSLKALGIGRGTDVKPLPQALRWIDPIFCSILGGEASILGAHHTFPFGLSVICYGHKGRL